MNGKERVAKTQAQFTRVSEFLYQNGVGKIDEKPRADGIMVFASSEAQGGNHDFSWRMDTRQDGGHVAVTLKKTDALETELYYSTLPDTWRLRWHVRPEYSAALAWVGLADEGEMDILDDEVEVQLHGFIAAASELSKAVAA